MTNNPGGYDLGTAHARVLIDASGVRDAMNQARSIFSGGLQGIGDGIQDVGKMIQGLGKDLTILTAPLNAFLITGEKVAASFEDVMTQIKVFGGVSGTELEKVRQFVLKMGADTVFSAADAGQAMLDLLKSGMSLKDAMATLPVVLQLATVGNLNLATASGIVSAALAQYGLKATDAGRVSEALARAASASRADVSDLGLALSNVGPIARTYGLSVEETAAILGVFANNGIMGAEAGTQLKSMLLNLSRPTDTVQGAMKKLGISLYDAKGNTKNLNLFIKEMDASLRKLPVEKQNELMQQLAGSYGITGLNALRASGGIGEMLNQMIKAPSAATITDASVGTLNRLTESFKGSVEALQTTVLQPFNEQVLKPLISNAIVLVNQITAWAAANPELAATITALLAGVSLLGPALLVVGTALGAIGGVIGFILSPVGLLIAAIAALAAAWVTDFGGIREAVMPILQELGNFLGGLWAKVQPSLNLIRDWFITDALPAVVAFIQNTVIPGVQKLVSFLSGIWITVSPTLGLLVDWFTTTGLPGILSFITDTIIPGIQGFIDTLARIWTDVSPFLTDLFNWFVTDALPTVAGVISGFMTNIVQPLIDILGGIWAAVQPALQSLYDWFITSGLPKIKENGQILYDKVIKPLVEIMEKMWETVKPGLEAVAKFFREEGPKIGQWIGEHITKAFDGLLGIIKGVVTWLGDAITKIKEFLGLSGRINESEATKKFSLGQIPTGDYFGAHAANQAYMVGKGAQPELFMSSSQTVGIPNFDKLLAGMGPSIGNLTIYANSQAEGAAAADGFATRFEQLYGRRG